MKKWDSNWQNIFKRYRLLIYVLVLILSRIPCIFPSLHGVNCDEAAIDYNIFCLSKFGVDRYGDAFPVYFANRMSGQSALYTYLGVLLTKLIGFGVARCRLIKLAAEVVTFVFGGKLVGRFLSSRAENIFLFLYVICPYFYMMSGFSFDCDLIIPVYVLCMYLAEQCIETGKTSKYIILGICVGLLSYSYILGALMVPLFLFVHFFSDSNKKNVIKEAAVAFAVDIPIAYYILTLLGLVPEIRTEFITIAPVSKARMGDLGFLPDNIRRLKYCILQDPAFDFAASKRFGTIYVVSLLFVAIGLLAFIIHFKCRKRIFCYFAAAVVPLLFIKSATTYNYTVLYYFLLVFAAAGLESLFHNYKTLGVTVLAGYLVMFGFFLREYYTADMYVYFDDGLIPLLEDLDMGNKVMLDTAGVILPECYIGIALRANPYGITYDEHYDAVSFGNIWFDDAEVSLEYDTVILRNDIGYAYLSFSGTGDSGLNDVQVRETAEEYAKLGYIKEKKGCYYVFRKESD